MKTVCSLPTWQYFKLQSYSEGRGRTRLVFPSLCFTPTHPLLGLLVSVGVQSQEGRAVQIDQEVPRWLVLSWPAIGSLRVWGTFELILPQCSLIISSEISSCRRLIEVAPLTVKTVLFLIMHAAISALVPTGVALAFPDWHCFWQETVWFKVL